MYGLLQSKNRTYEPLLIATVIVGKLCTQRRMRAFDGCYSCNH